jgi:hypothetical protein
MKNSYEKSKEKRIFNILLHIGALIISIPLAILIVNSAAFFFTAGIAIVLTLLIVNSISN